MPVTLLPASAKAFATRGSPNIVLGSKAEPWLTQTLRRINRIKRTLNNPAQHTKCLTETLAAPSALWTLCSIMLPSAPESKFLQHENPLIEAMNNYKLVHVEAYVVHVDMVSQNEVSFKLTQDSIDMLVEYYKDIFLVDAAAKTWHWSEKETQLKKLQEDFVQAINRYVFRTVAQALEGLEEDGSGELLQGIADDVKNEILGLFLPLLPPPPRAPEVIHPTPILPSSTVPESWWPSQVYQQQESWRMAPSSPSTTSSVDSSSSMWTSLSMDDFSIPSPSSPYSQPYTTSCFDTTQFYSSAMTSEMTCAPMTSAPLMAPLSLPSMLMPFQCSAAAGYDGGYGGFTWDRYNEYSVPFVVDTM
ncbi:MAG: hypothetical protein GOMPHAMPRED_006977 [Gomphillus americanus]|uniref:Uncharacterized protein n=1 Tax=Gomphillus americanus TaxID=1940652 RepID=A0A8H3I9L9_9LECA|nr:MAG: hypothetical protein GOMPHAMPRED_006977 [Gomphillus americanus]